MDSSERDESNFLIKMISKPGDRSPGDLFNNDLNKLYDAVIYIRPCHGLATHVKPDETGWTGYFLDFMQPLDAEWLRIFETPGPPTYQIPDEIQTRLFDRMIPALRKMRTILDRNEVKEWVRMPITLHITPVNEEFPAGIDALLSITMAFIAEADDALML